MRKNKRNTRCSGILNLLFTAARFVFLKKSGLYGRLGEGWVLNKKGMMRLKMGEA